MSEHSHLWLDLPNVLHVRQDSTTIKLLNQRVINVRLGIFVPCKVPNLYHAVLVPSARHYNQLHVHYVLLAPFKMKMVNFHANSVTLVIFKI